MNLLFPKKSPRRLRKILCPRLRNEIPCFGTLAMFFFFCKACVVMKCAKKLFQNKMKCIITEDEPLINAYIKVD